MPFDESLLEDVPETKPGFDESLLEDVPDEQVVAEDKPSEFTTRLQSGTMNEILPERLKTPVSIAQLIQERSKPLFPTEIDMEAANKIQLTPEQKEYVESHSEQEANKPFFTIPPKAIESVMGPLIPQKIKEGASESISTAISPSPMLLAQTPSFFAPVVGKTLMGYYGGKGSLQAVRNLSKAQSQKEVGSELANLGLNLAMVAPVVKSVGKPIVSGIEKIATEQPREALPEPVIKVQSPLIEAKIAEANEAIAKTLNEPIQKSVGEQFGVIDKATVELELAGVPNDLIDPLIQGKVKASEVIKDVETAKDAQRVIDKYAIQERPATQVLQDVREQPGQVKQSLPSEASPEGIQSGQQAQAAGTSDFPLEGPIPIPPPAKGVVAQKFGEFADYLAGKKQGPDVEPVLQNKSLPDFNEHSVNKQMLSQPYAMERVPILGALFGGMRRLKGSVPESVVTYFGERNIGRSIASALAQEYRYLDDVFKIKDGQITNIGQTKPGQSLFMADVFEALQDNPNAYKLSPEQQIAFGKMMELENEFNNLQSKHKIGNVVDAESGDIINPNESKKSYFPRIVTKHPASSEGTIKKGQAVGGKAFFEKSRMFDTEMEGWLKGYRYEDSIARRLGTRAERLYKRIADKRLIEDPELGGVTRKELVRDLEMKYAEELQSGEMTPEKIQQIADSVESQRSTGIPTFRHKIFDAKTAKQLQKLFPVNASPIRSGLAAINNAIKALWLGFDFGVGLIQGQTLMFNRPKVWLNAWKGSLQAMANPRYFSEYVRKNIEPVRELSQLGSAVGRMEEMMSGMESGELIHTIPGLKAVGAVAKPFARQFQTFLDTAKIEMWKGLREVTPKSEWPRVVQTIESTLSSARMEAIGISRNRALTERVFLMAPSYYRGAAQMIGAMAEKGVSGQVARRSLTAYMIGGAVLYYGFAKMLGMKEDEIIKRMDPRRPDFMMWRIKNGERNTEVGLGGIYRSLIKLMGNMYKTSVENPGNWASMTSDKNPIIKWYRGHSGPIVGTGWDLMTGKDFMGKESALNFGLAKKLFPMVIGAVMNSDQKFSPIDVGVTFMGGTAFERPNEMQQEVGRLSSKFLKSKGIEKPQFTFKEDQVTYGNMFNALRNGKDERAVEIYKELSKTRKPYEIDSHLKELIDRPFTGSKKLEREFYETLNKQEQEYYKLALAERQQEVLKLVKLITEQSK